LASNKSKININKIRISVVFNKKNHPFAKFPKFLTLPKTAFSLLPESPSGEGLAFPTSLKILIFSHFLANKTHQIRKNHQKLT
jgi:hypothetical protein